MFTASTQYLEVHLPSPTTVSFTVTTRRRPGSKISLLVLLRHALRVLLVFYVLLVNLAKVQAASLLGSFDRYANFFLRLSLMNGLLRLVGENTEWWVLAPVSALLVWLCLRRDYVGRSEQGVSLKLMPQPSQRRMLTKPLL